MTDYAELEIGLHCGDEEHYAVELRFSRADSEADGRILSTTVTAQFDLAALRQHGPDDVRYGQLLTKSLLTDTQLQATFEEAYSLAQAHDPPLPLRVRLFIDAGAPELHSLRWECLLRQGVGRPIPLASGPNSPFSRLLYPDSNAHRRTPKTGWPLRIVLAVSNPVNLARFDLSPVDVSLEQGQLEQALRPLQGLIDLERIEPPVSLDRICLYLEKEPDIFHFTGHGAFSAKSGRAALFLEDEADRTAQIVSHDEWFERLAALSRPPHVMTLTACESAAQVNAGVLVGLAPALIEAGGGAVVAMQDKIGVEVAREFNYHFYRRLATHGQIDLAANEARSYLLDRGGWSWSQPALFMERGAERIFAAPPETLEVAPAQSGEILILIPEFKGHEEAFFEIDLRDTLQTHVAAADLKDVRVAWLKQAAFGPGDEDAVRRLAARYGAALVIWGWYDRSRFRACFSVTEALFAYRDPLVFRPSASARSLLQTEQDFALFVNQALPQQVDYFVFFTLSQLYYWAGDYASALNALTQVIESGQRAAEPDQPEGLAYVYFYRGNLLAIHRQDRPAAIRDYRQALALAPDFAHAAFNLGGSQRILANTYRHQGDERAARQSYQAALAAYAQALTIEPDYVLAYEGRALTHYELGANEAAIADYRQALAREPHAETYHQLGLALRNLGRFDEALTQFDQALAFAPGTGFYYFSRGRLRARLGDEGGASADFQAYLRLVPSDPERRGKVETWLVQRGISN